MRSISRRAFFASLGAVVVAFGAVSLPTGIRSWIMRQIEEEFGTDVAGTADASAFTNDLLAYLEATDPATYGRISWHFRLKPRFVGDLVSQESELRRQVIDLFLLSTNYVLANERATTSIMSLCATIPHPCSNQLSSVYLRERAL
jgi:hypothetical protein